jgi:hypothetical protein
MTVGETTDLEIIDTQSGCVGVSPYSGSGMRGHTWRDIQCQSASILVSEDEGTARSVTPTVAMSPILLSLKELHRSREMFVKVEVMTGNQILKIDAALGLCEWVPTSHGHGKYAYKEGRRRTDCRVIPEGALSSPAFLAAKDSMVALQAQARKSRLEHERTMRREARQLPVWPWVEGVRGAGDLGLAQIVAESMGADTVNGLSDYGSPAKLWKRFGLAVIDGAAQGRRKGELGEVMGFSPQRRKLMYLIADSLMKGNRDGYFKEFYNAEKAKHADREGITKAHAHNRALRALAKEYLEHLWRAWRAVENGMTDQRPIGAQPSCVRIPPSAEDHAA